MAGLPGLRFAAWEAPQNPGAREVVGSNPTDPTKPPPRYILPRATSDYSALNIVARQQMILRYSKVQPSETHG